MSADSDATEKRSSKRANCDRCNGSGRVEVIDGDETRTVGCKICVGFGYQPASGHYIIYDQFRDIVNKEKKKMYRLLFNVLWYMGLKSGEALKIRPNDINAVNPEKYGLSSDVDTIRIWTSPKKSRILPIPNWLKNEILEYAAEKEIKSDSYVFDRNRTTLFQRLSSHGLTVGGKKRIGTEALRKGFGIWYLSEGGHLEDLQVIYGHTEVALTQSYLAIAINKTRAQRNFAYFQKNLRHR